MNVVIRNTFLHLSQDSELQDDDDSHKARSNSAPPTCRHAKSGDVDGESEASTRCLTFGEVDDGTSPASKYERGDTSPRTTIAGEDAHSNAARSSTSMVKVSVPADAQPQIEAISEKVMGVWSQLRSLEQEVATTSSECSPRSTMPQGPVIWMPVQLPSQWVPAHMGGIQPSQPSVRTPLKAPRLDAKAPSFTPTCKAFGGFQDLLASVKQLLTLAPGVANVDVDFAQEGTLASISIKLDSSASKSGVILAAKGVLSQAAANSQTVYVLGYEAEPFKDLSDTAFLTMLASLPIEWQHSACWETYQAGVCPRGKSCKWLHPGKRELQPVRVSVS